MARTSASSRPLTNHDEIRHWAEERNARPTCVRGTGGRNDIGMIRLDFPGYSGEDKLEEISWDKWFDKFDESGLALLVQEQTARGQRSNFNKLVSRETAGLSEDDESFRASRSSQRRESGIRASSRDEEEYEVSADDSADSVEDAEGTDEDFEEEMQETRPVRMGGAGTSSNRQSQSRTTNRAANRSTRSSAKSRRKTSQSARSRNEKSPRGRSATAKRSQAKSGSRSSAKKPAGRSTASNSRTSRKTSSRKRAA